MDGAGDGSGHEGSVGAVVPPGPAHPPAGDHGTRVVAIATWVGVFLPYVALAAARIGSTWLPVQDQAVLDLRVRDVLAGSDVPLVGAFSRFGWSHPGPIWFYLLAPFRAVGGTTGMLAGSILLFGAGTSTAVVLVVRRYGPLVGALAALAVAPVIAASGSFTLIVPWNPHLAAAWYPAFLVLCVSAADRRARDLVPACFLAAALVQLHVGFVVLAAMPLLVATLATLVRERHRLGPVTRRGATRAATWAWIAAAVAIWSPPVLEQLRHGAAGNLAALQRFFLDGPGTDPPAGGRFAAGVLGGVLRLPLTGLGGRGEARDAYTGDLVAGTPWALLAIVVVLAAAATASLARRDARGARIVAVLAAVAASGFVALSRLLGERWPYLFIWRFALVWCVVVGCLIVLARGSALAGHLLGWPIARRRSLLAVAVVVLGATTVLTAWGRPAEQFPGQEAQARGLLDAVERAGPPHGDVTIVRFGGHLIGVADALLDRLDGLGSPVHVLPDLGYKYGDSRTLSPDRADEVWFVTEDSIATTVAAAVPGARPVAATTPLDPAEDAQLQAAQLSLLVRLRDAGRLDLATSLQSDVVGVVFDRAGIDTGDVDVNRLAELNRKVADSGSCRCAVVVVPASTPTDLEAVAAGLPEQAGS